MLAIHINDYTQKINDINRLLDGDTDRLDTSFLEVLRDRKRRYIHFIAILESLKD